jgi:hypothetical protein
MVKRDQKALLRIIRRLESEYQEEAKEAAEELYALLDRGCKVEAALAQLRKDHPALFQLSGLQDAMVEAAAYGYGIVPAILTDTQAKAWRRALSKSWDDSGMTLSEKIHGAGVKMRESIISTIRSQMRRNATWTSMSRELYDGYNSGKAVTMQQALPKYLQTVRNAYGTPRIVAESRKALRNIERLSQNGAPTKALKAAYKQLVEIAQTGTEEALNKACWVAMQEKSRYIADRIARTEMARAWADGFLADIMQDDDVVAVKWKLSSRHPVFDVCDMYAKADMYGLGAGIYPKDKLPPLPVHPHCLCRYVEVIEGEVDMQQQRNQVQAAGNKWLNSLPESRRVQVLGRKGLKAWEDGEDWRKYMRGYAGLRENKSCLQSMPDKNIIRATEVWEGHGSLPRDSKPNAIIDHVFDNGVVRARAFYNDKGRKYKEIHTTNHGKPKAHPFGEHGEHGHIYQWNSDGSLKSKIPYELSDKERKENQEIL